MARQVRIDVVANIAGTRQVFGALSNEVNALKAQMEGLRRVETNLAQQTILGTGGRFGTGLFDSADPTANIRTTFERFQNTIKQTTTVVKGGISSTLTSFSGDFDRVMRGLDSYRAAIDGVVGPAISRFSSLNLTINNEALAWDNAAAAAQRYEIVRRGAALRVLDTGDPSDPNSIPHILSRQETATVFGTNRPGLLRDYQDAINRYRQAVSFIESGAGGAEAELLRLRAEQPPLPTNFRQIALQSPSLLRTLTKAGVAGSTNDVAGLYATGAAQSFKVQEDLTRQVTRVTGAFTDQFGTLKRINVEYDRSGNVVTSLGGRLRNLGSAITQTGRDILKMSEWAIAAVAVYGAINKIGQTVGTILTLDKQLHQLGITANLTNEQTAKLRDRLADVAIETATPLTELVGAADNVALAVKQVGDSAEQTEEKIVSMSRSVGILTNLSGIDTVRATDLLTSAYKQLGLTVDQIPSLLDKVTAVAGGQSNAIADVITAVAQLGEAAKVGNLNTAELVGTVQVLSQVTAKSPAEVATAIKNLIGSLGSPGAKKALESFGIDLKKTMADGTVQVKSLIDIYGELVTKFKTGEIPEADQQAVIRAISGGPRRAPDAAALLGSYNQIANAVRIAQNASNESTIANLKVLDSAQAKLVQLQATFDKFTTAKFTEIIRDSVGNLAEILTKILGILDRVDPSLYEFIGTLGLIAVGTKALGFLFRNIAGVIVTVGENFGLLNRVQIQTALGFREMAIEGQKAANSIRAAGTAAATANRTGGGFLGGIGSTLAKSRSALVPIAAGVATGAALDIATGASPKGIIQNVLLGGGIAALTVPEPTGITKLIGVLGIAGGLLLSFVKDEEKVKDSVSVSSEELLQSVTAYQQASSQIKAITDDNANLAAAIEQVHQKQTLTTEDLQRLAGLQDQYATNVIAQIKANLQLQESFNTLKENIESIGGLTSEERIALKIKIDAAIAGQLDPETVKTLVAKITQQFLQQADPEKYKNVGNFEFKPPIQLEPQLLVDKQKLRDNIQTILDNSISHGELLPTRLNPTVNPVLTAQVENAARAANITPQQFIEAYNNNIQALKQQQQALDDIVDPAKRYDNILQQIAIDKQALISQGLLHLISADEVDRGTKLLDLLKRAVELRQQVPNKTVGVFLEPDQATQVNLGQPQADRDLLNIQSLIFKSQQQGFQLTKEDAISAGESILRLSGQFDVLGDKALAIKTIQKFFDDLGYSISIVTKETLDAQDALAAMAKEQAANRKSIREGYISELTDLTSQRSKLEAQIQGENQTVPTTKNDVAQHNARLKGYKEELDQVNALIRLNAQLRKGLLDINAVSPKGITDFKNELSKVHGLESLVYVDNSNLVSSLISLAQQFGLTGDQVVQLGQKLGILLALVKALDGLKAVITVDIETATNQLTGPNGYVASDEANLIARSRGVGGVSDIGKAWQTQVQGIIDWITGLFRTGKGSALGSTTVPGGAGGSTTKNGLDVSNLDITDEIYNAVNRQALIDEAIRRARAVQHKIPGEDKEAKNDLVALLHGTEFLQNVRGVKEEYLRKAIEELTAVEKKRLEFETKADTIRRIRIGSGDFAAIANVPFNAASNVSVGGPQGPITVNLNLNGQILTPAQAVRVGNIIAAPIKQAIAG